MVSEKFLKVRGVITLFFFTWVLFMADFIFADIPVEESQVEGKSVYVSTERNQERSGIGEQKESEYRTNIIVKEGKKKKWRKWLFIIGGIVLIGGGIAYYCWSKKRKCHYDEKVMGFEWVEIAAGAFEMGDHFNDGDADEKPTHPVELDAYKISKYEVTFEQYDKYCDSTGHPKPDDNGWGRGKRPVISVSYEDAKAFCDWLSKKSTCYNFDLPTEAQWERAARGTEQRKYPWGDSSPGCNLANYGTCRGGPVEVGSYTGGKSSGGVHDMAGNVWEWCKDWYGSSYYADLGNNGRNPQGPASGSTRVLRGGGYNSNSKNIRSTERYNRNPSYKDERIGFRVCRYEE